MSNEASCKISVKKQMFEQTTKKYPFQLNSFLTKKPIFVKLINIK